MMSRSTTKSKVYAQAAKKLYETGYRSYVGQWSHPCGLESLSIESEAPEQLVYAVVKDVAQKLGAPVEAMIPSVVEHDLPVKVYHS